MPCVSVIMPAYNSEKTISEAVTSVLRQTFDDLELLIVNDCSSDGTDEIIRSFAKEDPRIVIIENEKNSGVSYSRNVAIARADGEWIAFLDSDDVWREDKLESQLRLMSEHPGSSICYTASAFMDSRGNPYQYVMAAEEKIEYSTLLRKNLLSCSSVMIRASVMKDIKMPSDRMHEDYYTWLTVLRDGGYACGINEPMLTYRLSENSKSSGRVKSAKMLYRTYRAVGYNAIVSGMLVSRYFWHSVTKRYKIKNA